MSQITMFLLQARPPVPVSELVWPCDHPAALPPRVRLCLVCQALLHRAGGLRGPVQLPLGDRPQLRAQRHRGGNPQGPAVSGSLSLISLDCAFRMKVKTYFD